jgi:hypothetical protein
MGSLLAAIVQYLTLSFLLGRASMCMHPRLTHLQDYQPL